MDSDSLPVGPLAGVAAYLDTLGHDGHALLRRFGVDQRVLRDPLTPTPAYLHGSIHLAAIEVSGKEDLPILVGGRSQLDNVGPVRALALNAATARIAIEDLQHYASMWYRCLNLTLEEDQGYAILGYSAKLEFPGREALLSAFLAGGVTNMRLVLGADWSPALVRVAHRRPASLAAWSQLFRAPILFDQPRHELLFLAADLDKPRGRTDRQLEVFLKQQLDDLKAKQPTKFIDQVTHAIESQLLRGDFSNDRIASLFGIHRHTLYRRLNEHGADYSALLEQSRRRLATRMLSDTDMAMGEIAAVLGYRSQGNFTRAFYRWFDSTPSEWRRLNVLLNISHQDVGISVP